MKKNIRVFIITLLLVILAGSVYYGVSVFRAYAPKNYVSGSGTSTINTTTGEVTNSVKSFTLAEVATHNNSTSCYTIINNGVYDLTLFINVHEGGAPAIMSLCGHDGTEAFMNQHKGGEKFMRVLSRFKIGNSA